MEPSGLGEVSLPRNTAQPHHEVLLRTLLLATNNGFFSRYRKTPTHRTQG